MENALNALAISLFIITVSIHGEPLQRSGEFPYMKCAQGVEDIVCENINITKAGHEKDSAWPPGPFAILVSKSQCPESEQHGWRKGIMKIKSSSNTIEETLHFCVKINRSYTMADDNGTWMPGNYTIYMINGTCPQGFNATSYNIPFSTFGQSGHVPQYTITERSDGKGMLISFNVCMPNEVNASVADILSDPIWFIDQFMSGEDCQEVFGEITDDSACFMYHPRLYSNWLISPVFFLSGIMSDQSHVNDGLLWKHFDLFRTLQISVILAEFSDDFKEVFVSCVMSNVKWDFLTGHARDCKAKLSEGWYGTQLVLRRHTYARFFTLFFTTRIPEADIVFYLPNLPESSICNEDLGMEDGSIQDFQITTSSGFTDNVISTSRPYNTGWCPRGDDSSPWIMVDLMTVVRIEGFTLWTKNVNRGIMDGNFTVCGLFSLIYGYNIDSLMFNDNYQISKQKHTPYGQTVMLLNSIEARYIKLEFQSCNATDISCLSFELHGCKLAGIPNLDCPSEADIVNVKHELHSSLERTFYNDVNSYNVCSYLCSESYNCSSFEYKTSGYCVHYPISQSWNWHMSSTKTDQWGAKICSKGYAELFPVFQYESDVVSTAYYGRAANQQLLTHDAIVTSLGYPFPSGNGQVYKWLMNFPSGRYLRLVFTNISLYHQVDGCLDTIQFNKFLINTNLDETLIDYKFNKRSFVVETELSFLHMTFSTCSAKGQVTERGFRAIVSSKAIGACLWVDLDYQALIGGDTAEKCDKKTMFITSKSILNFPFESIKENWIIELVNTHGTLQIQIEDFYIICANDRRNQSSLLTISNNNTFESVLCNTNRPMDVINVKDTVLYVTFDRYINTEITYLRKEGFRFLYSLVEHSFQHLITTNLSDNTFCSDQFMKCYNLHSKLTTWNEASEICRQCKQVLVSIHSRSELEFINFLLREQWISEEFTDEETYIEDISYVAHVGLKGRSNQHGMKTYSWEDSTPVTFFPWKSGNPSVGKDCVRTNFHRIENRTLESEDCIADLAPFFICESPFSVDETAGNIREEPLCDGKSEINSDIAFIVERMEVGLFQDTVQFIIDIVTDLNIGPEASQIALVTYADTVEVVFNFNDCNTSNDVIDKLASAQTYYPLTLLSTNTYLALEKANGVIFSQFNGARLNVPRVVILIGTSVQSRREETIKQADILKRFGVSVFALSINYPDWENGSDVYPDLVSEPSSATFFNITFTYELDLTLREEMLRKVSNIATSVDTCKGVVWRKWKYTSQLTSSFSESVCHSWNSLSTQAEHNFLSRFPGISLPYGAQNSCQDPDSSGILWCYTLQGGRLWEPCFLQRPTLDNTGTNTTYTNTTYTNTTYTVNNTTYAECNDGQMIRRRHVCDGVFDCTDYSDEINCKENEPVPYRLERGSYFQCGTMEWISILAKCDDVIDCADASDELNCILIDEDFSKRAFSCDNGDCPMCNLETDILTEEEELREFRTCDLSEFTCANGQCMPMTSRCNANLDCIDGSDEIQCDSCVGSFHCDTGRCIPMRLRCDGFPDCADGSDEDGCVFDPESISSCDDWWKHGYHDSGNYVIDGLTVYCDFTLLRDHEVIKMMIRNIDVDVDIGMLYTRLSFDNFLTLKTQTFRNLVNRDGYTCFLKIERKCNFETMVAITADSEGDGNDELIDKCQCVIEHININYFTEKPNRTLSYCNGTVLGDTDINEVYFNVTEDGGFHIDDVILDPIVPIQLTPKQISCTYNYREDANWCVYNLDSMGVILGHRSANRLLDCGDFPCPAHTVKCPGSYCIPISFVCDGKFQCPRGEDEFECTCANTDREVLILMEDTVMDTESQTAAIDLAKQLHTSESDIRLLYFTTLVPLKGYHIEHRLLQIRETKYETLQLLESDTECQFKSMSRNLLDQIKFQMNDSRALIFIEDSIESSEVAKLMFSNISEHTFMIYRVVHDSKYSVKDKHSNAYRFVEDVVVRRWNVLHEIGYKRFTELCGSVSEVPCVGGYRCATSKQCIPLSQVCDGITHCPSKDDERLCDIFCPFNCTCVGYTAICRNASLSYIDTRSLSQNTKIADMSFNPDLNGVLVQNNFQFSYMTKLNLSSCAIMDINKEGFASFSNLKCLDLSYNEMRILPKSVFSYLKNLIYINLDGNFDLQVISSTAFQGLTQIRHLRITQTRLKFISQYTFSGLDLQAIDLSNNEITEVEDYAFNGSTLRTIDIRGNNILTFNKLMFQGILSLEQLKTPAFKFCCIRPCSVNENNCFPRQNEFSSCADLMRHPILQAILWIVGITALFGNAGSIFYRLVFDRERLKIGYGIFVTHLAGADLLMGVYLLMIAIVDSYYRNRYILFDDWWRNSNWCSLAGILSTVSSEASVLFVCLITLDRLLVIKYPFGNKRFDPIKAQICCIASWTLSFLIAIIPIAYTEYFEHRFYSRSPVCIALPLTREKPPGWMYSVTIFVGLNFCTFILVAVGQIAIFLELRKSRSTIKKTQQSRKRDLQVARNLIIVATTDFMCWFPIGLMGIMTLNGYHISGDVYAWTAVFILPLNSALNPILYTLTAIIGKKSFNPDVKEQDRPEIMKESAYVLMKQQDLIKSIRLKGAIARSGIPVEKMLQAREPIALSTIAVICIQLSKYMSLLHDSSIIISDLSKHTTNVKVDLRKVYKVSIVIDSKISVTSDERQLQDNIYQLGTLLRALTSHYTKIKMGGQ